MAVKRLLMALLFVVMAAVPMNSQTNIKNFNNTISGIGAPGLNIPCTIQNPGQAYLDQSNGRVYGCSDGTWKTVSGGGGSPAGTLDVQGSNQNGTLFAITGMKYSTNAANAFVESNVGFSRYGYNTQNVLPSSTIYYSHANGCWSNQIKNGGSFTTACQPWTFNAFGPGLNHGNTAYDPGWSVNQFVRGSLTYAKNGISQALSIQMLSSKLGDNGGIYLYINHKGGMNDNSSEGTVGYALNLTTAQATDTFRMFAQPAPDQPGSVTPLAVGGYGGIPQSGSILAQYQNASKVLNPAITGCYLKSNPDRTTVEVSGCVLTPAKHSCNVLDVINIPANEPTGTQVSFKCHPTSLDGSPMEMTTRMLFGGAFNQPEPFYPISVSAPDGNGDQTITAIFHHAHPVANWPVYDDANYGNAWFDLAADNVGVDNNFWQTSLGYVVAGALDSTHLDIRSYSSFFPGDPPGYQQSGIEQWKHRFPVSQSGITFTRSGNVVTACGVPVEYSGQIVLVAASNTGFNGTFTLSTLSNASGPQCATYSQTGADASTSGTVTMGGDVGGTNGLGYVQIVPAAYIQYTNGVTTTVGNHQEISYGGAPVVLLPNNLSNVTAYNGFINPFHNSISSLGTSIRQFVDAPMLVNKYFQARVSGASPIALEVRNDVAYNQYIGGGGNGLLFPGEVFQSIGPIGGVGEYLSPLTVNSADGVGRRFFSHVNPVCNSSLQTSCVDADIFEPRLPNQSDWHMDIYDRQLGYRYIKNNRFNGSGVRFYASYYSGTDTYHAGSTGVTGPWYFDTTFTGTCANSLETDSNGRTYRNACRAPQPSADGFQLWNNTTKAWTAMPSGFTGSCPATATLTVVNGIITGCS